MCRHSRARCTQVLAKAAVLGSCPEVLVQCFDMGQVLLAALRPGLLIARGSDADQIFVEIRILQCTIVVFDLC